MHVEGGKARRKETTSKENVGGRVILKWILEGQDGVVWIGLVWLRICTGREFS
jgi:hypothetical protein